ncbi:MAG: histidine kinase [Bacteroidales bacterium]|nr:histidine kinase [Bacteroidales bacterium]
MMRNKTLKDYPDIKLVVYLSVAISVLMHLMMFLSFRFGEGIIFQQMGEHKRPPFHFDGFLLNVLSTFLLAFVLYMYNMYIHKTVKRSRNYMLLLILGSIIITVILSFIFTSLHPYLLGHSDYQIPINRKVHIYRNGLMNDFFVTMVVVFSWQLLVSNYKSRKMAVENESLIAENLLTRYEILKSQMNPHFLFNSLNTLQSLIEIDKEKAKDYVQELSKVLRYSLQNQEVVTLEEEMHLSNSYCKLMEIRYGDNLKINFDIDERLRKNEIIPLTLQVLIENAIKHNVISDKQPLVINITSDYEKCNVMICNKIQPKINKSPGNGIGLANLSERYRLKWNTDIEILNNNVEFCVVIKLKNIDKN